MAIQSAYLQNFTVFEKVNIPFSTGINVIIGTNGTGKTHLLKVLYGICEELNSTLKEKAELSEAYFSVQPEDLIRNKQKHNHAFVEAVFSDTSSVVYDLAKSEQIKLSDNESASGVAFSQIKSIFITRKPLALTSQ